MPSYNEDMLAALFMVACLYDVQEIREAHKYYIVLFEGTVANLMFDKSQITREEIEQTIAEAKA